MVNISNVLLGNLNVFRPAGRKLLRWEHCLQNKMKMATERVLPQTYSTVLNESEVEK